MANSGNKRSHPSTSSTPSPTVRNRSYKCLRTVDTESEDSGEEETMDNIREAVQMAMETSLKGELQGVESRKCSPSEGKKSKNGKAKGTSPAQEATASGHIKQASGDSPPLPVETIVQEVVRGLVPALTTAISTAINAAMQTLVSSVVKQTTEIVQKGMEDQLRQQSSIHKYEIDRLEQYTQRESIRVAGLEESPDETDEGLRDTLVKMVRDMEIEIQSSDISVCHRLGRRDSGSGRQRHRPVICKFVARRHKTAVMEKKKNLKGMDEYKRVYVNEDLTPLRSRLLSVARKTDTVKNAITRD